MDLYYSTVVMNNIRVNQRFSSPMISADLETARRHLLTEHCIETTTANTIEGREKLDNCLRCVLHSWDPGILRKKNDILLLELIGFEPISPWIIKRCFWPLFRIPENKRRWECTRCGQLFLSQPDVSGALQHLASQHSVTEVSICPCDIAGWLQIFLIKYFTIIW